VQFTVHGMEAITKQSVHARIMRFMSRRCIDPDWVPAFAGTTIVN
jgi:hypothetical protein